jgi:hypothetical protein
MHILSTPKDTKINPNSTPINFTKEELILELKGRGLLKDDMDKTFVNVKTELGENIVVGKSDFKFTQQGQAYVEFIEKQNPSQLFHNIPDKEESSIEYNIAVLPLDANNFLPSGKQKHLVISYNKTSEEYHVIGYLTSKDSGIFISNKQFLDFETLSN